MKCLPLRFFPRPGRKIVARFLCGWITSWIKITDFVIKEYPNHLVYRSDDDKSDIDRIYTSIMFGYQLVESCQLPTLTIRLSWAGPRPSDMLPVVAIYTNNSENREKILGSNGVQKLKGMLDFKEDPQWVVNTENTHWPAF